MSNTRTNLILIGLLTLSAPLIAVAGTTPTFLVSNDAADNPDYATIQEAVDAVTVAGTTIEILPGTGPYFEVDLDGTPPLNLVGIGGTVSIQGGFFPAVSTSATTGVPVRIHNLRLSGAFQGVQFRSDTIVEDCEILSGLSGVELLGGTHEINRVTIEADATGIYLAQGARLTGDRIHIKPGGGIGVDLTDAGSATTAYLTNSLIAAMDMGIRIQSDSHLDLYHSTIANNVDGGVVAEENGTADIAYSIMWNNFSGDMIGIPCASARWSNSAIPSCTTINHNVSVDPDFVFLVDFRLKPTSPLIDMAPIPATYPCVDLDGNPRVEDFDGIPGTINSQSAEIDLGAYETVAPVAEVGMLQWTDSATVSWPASDGATEYHVYRGPDPAIDIAPLPCRDDLDIDRTDTRLLDHDVPPVGEAFYYIVTQGTASGTEGTQGHGSCGLRPSGDRCRQR